MKNFIIEKIKNQEQYIILSTSYISPLDDIQILQDELKKLTYTGKIIIDLLLCNGLSSNRYIEAFFNGEILDVSSVKVVDNVSTIVKETSKLFYKDNKSILERSILPKAHCYIIENGLI